MKKHLLSVIMILTAMILSFTLPAGAVSESDPLQIVKIERGAEADTIIVRFNKAVTLDTANIFSWFGHDMGVNSESGIQGINMDYGTGDNTLIENNTAIRVKFDNGVVNDFFGREGKYFFVFHLNMAGVIKTSDGQEPAYSPVDLYQGDEFKGTLGYADYIAVSDIIAQENQPPAEPLKIVKNERGTEADTMIVRFDKPCTLDAANIFSWFGYDKGTNSETGYVCINMTYGSSDNTLIENNTAMRVKFDAGVVEEYFSQKEGKEGKYYFVFHQNMSGALKSTEGGELVYRPVDLYQEDKLVGTLGFAEYIALSDIIGNKPIDPPDTADGILSMIAVVSVIALAGFCLSRKR